MSSFMDVQYSSFFACHHCCESFAVFPLCFHSLQFDACSTSLHGESSMELSTVHLSSFVCQLQHFLFPYRFLSQNSLHICILFCTTIYTTVVSFGSLVHSGCLMWCIFYSIVSLCFILFLSVLRLYSTITVFTPLPYSTSPAFLISNLQPLDL